MVTKEQEQAIANEVAVQMAVYAKDVLNSREAAMYLGFSLSRLYKLTCYKQIPHFKPRGKIMYFSRTELDAWRLRNRIATNDEINSQAKAMAARM